MVKRLFITTADERTWDSKQPVLFLGEWCKLYDRKAIWRHMDAVVAKPYGIQKDQKEQDRIYLNGVIAQLKIELYNELNDFHQEKHEHRYWDMLLGQWLQRWVYVTYNRYQCIVQALAKNEISGTKVLKLKQYQLATQNTIDLVWALYDQVWNHVLYTRIIRFLNQIEVTEIEVDDLSIGFKPDSNFKVDEKSVILIRDTINKVLRLFVKNSDAFILKSYLPITRAVELQLKLRQIPPFWSNPEIPESAYYPSDRTKLIFKEEGKIGFELFIRTIIGESIPICFVEGYKSIRDFCNHLKWPKDPKFIFTSNSFDTDEAFKFWAAEKAEKGVPYYIGQHGNNYGTLTYSQEMPEIKYADQFLTWGWENDAPNIKRAFIFNTLNKKHIKHNPAGGLLLIERCLHSRQSTYDSYFENLIYQEQQFRFVKWLPFLIKDKLTVRLQYHQPSNLDWSDEKRWNDFDNTITLDMGRQSIWDLLKQNRLIVYSYDSTGLLETLSLNLPTIGFWYHVLEEILPTAKPYYQKLLDCGVFFETPDEAAQHITKHWNNIDAWWYSDSVQAARIEFCNQFAHIEKRPMKKLLSILTAKAS